MVTALFILMMNFENADSKENRLKNLMNTEKVTETNLKIENWMIDEKIWNKQAGNYFLVQESDKILSMEDWLTDEDFPKRQNAVLSDEQDSAMQVENWMIDAGVWKLN